MIKNLILKFAATMAILLVGVAAFAQQKISGTVKDANGQPVIGATVMVDGTQNGMVADIDGNWTLTVAPGSSITASCIGYADVKMSVTASQSVYNFILSEDALFLDETVVIGYQVVKRRDLTGSVASVNARDLSTAPVSNIAQALQGKLAGVNVVSQDGRPDATINIRVRGGGSISQSNDPLILIDGVVGTLSDIPSDQVESIDILKDASSTAIYGARGANGVVLITTKGAKEGRVKISYNGYAKYNTPTKYTDALGAYDYLAYTWALASAHDADYYAKPFAKLFGLGEYGDINRYKNVKTTDLQKKVYGPSFSHSHDLSISGGNDMTKVLFSVNYNDEDGMKVNSYHRRANVSLKVNQKVSDNLNFGLDMRYTDVTSVGDESAGSGNGSLLSSSFNFRPIATEDILGDLSALREGAIEAHGKGVLWDQYSAYNQIMDYEPLRQRQNIRGTASMNWTPIKGLTYHSELTLRRSYNQNHTWRGAVANNYLNDVTGEKNWAGSATLYKGDSWGMRWTNTLNYMFNIGKEHSFNFLLGQEMTNSGGESMTISQERFPANFTKENAFAMIDQYDKEASTQTRPFYSGYNTPSRILSYFTRLNYTLLDRYLFTATFRADGSSKFAPSNRWGFFPAGAFAWRVSQEPFMEDVSWMDDLKLRLSYGAVGNDGISSDLWSQTWSASSTMYYIENADKPSYTLAGTMANPDLKWETTITRNLGVDFGILKGKLSGSLEVYWNTTKDLLMRTALPGITGFTATYDNVGQTSNKGVELSLRANIVETKDWGLSLGANINFNKNNIDALAEGVSGRYGSSWFHAGNPGDDFGFEVGKPVGLVRGLVYEGMYSTDDFTYDSATDLYTLKPGIPDVSANITGVMHGIKTPEGQNAFPGMAKYKDADGNGVADAADYEIIGDMNAKFTGGFNINANYKNWDLGLYFNYSVGNQIYNINKMASMLGYKETGVYKNHLGLLKDAYKIYDIQNGQLVRMHTPEELNALNKSAIHPLCYNEGGVVSSAGIEDGSYLRLNTTTIGYTLPTESAFAKTMGISALRLYATVYNLLTLTKYTGIDPEVSTNERINDAVYPTPGLDWGAYPRARSFVFGVNVSF